MAARSRSHQDVKASSASCTVQYQRVSPSYWPVWGGGGDLYMGSGGPPGTYGECNPATYAGSDGEVCGDDYRTSGAPPTRSVVPNMHD
jgi:hypothetical protein